jgi:hypothetical protein
MQILDDGWTKLIVAKSPQRLLKNVRYIVFTHKAVHPPGPHPPDIAQSRFQGGSEVEITGNQGREIGPKKHLAPNHRASKNRTRWVG